MMPCKHAPPLHEMGAISAIRSVDRQQQREGNMLALPGEILIYTGQPYTVERPAQGMNFEVYILSTARGRFVLKIGGTPDKVAELENESRILDKLRREHPCCPAHRACRPERCRCSCSPASRGRTCLTPWRGQTALDGTTSSRSLRGRFAEYTTGNHRSLAPTIGSVSRCAAPSRTWRPEQLPIPSNIAASSVGWILELSWRRWCVGLPTSSTTWSSDMETTVCRTPWCATIPSRA